MTYKRAGSKSEVKLTAPWDSPIPQTASVEIEDAEIAIPNCELRTTEPPDHTTGLFVRERTRVHETYIIEQERTKRIGMILSVMLILGAGALILFAPEGRETLSYWIGAALIIFAAGAMGYKRVWGKSKNVVIGADQDQRDLR